MAVRQRGSTWQADVQWKGKRARGQFASEDEGKRWEAEALAALKVGKTPPDPDSFRRGSGDKRSLRAVLRLADKMHWSTLKGSSRTVCNATVFVDWCGPEADPVEVFTDDKITAFVEYLMDTRKSSNATINRYMSAVSVLQRFAKVPEPATLPWFKEGKGRIRFFTEDEELLVLQLWASWSLERERDFLMFLIDTGARPWSEGTAFTWKQQAKGRGFLNGGNKVTFDDTKNDIVRTIPLTQRAVQAVQRQPKHLEGPFADLSSSHMNHLWDRTRGHLEGLSDTVLYTARHTCASRLVQRGIDIRRVKEWMGHVNIATTMKYAHLAPNSLMDVVGVLEGSATVKLEVLQGGAAA